MPERLIRSLTTGDYLAAYDPEAYDGRGEVTWTTNPAEAITFPDTTAAYTLYMTVPACRPTREDGQPNRPLTGESIELVVTQATP